MLTQDIVGRSCPLCRRSAELSALKILPRKARGVEPSQKGGGDGWKRFRKLHQPCANCRSPNALVATETSARARNKSEATRQLISTGCAVRRLGTGFGGDPCSRFFYYIGNCREYLPRKRRRAKFQILSNAVWLRTWFLQTTYVVQIQRMPWACSILPCTARSASPCLSLLGTSSSLAG
jgi:hypothetical protein